MNISNWSIGDIMQLPDHLFGRRWPIGTYGAGDILAKSWQISNEGLPDRCVLWEIIYSGLIPVTTHASITLKMGDHLPANEAQFDAMEDIIPGVVGFGGERSQITVTGESHFRLSSLRQPIIAQGRRLIVETSDFTDVALRGALVIVISSIPTEVPDWLISGIHINP